MERARADAAQVLSSQLRTLQAVWCALQHANDDAVERTASHDARAALLGVLARGLVAAVDDFRAVTSGVHDGDLLGEGGPTAHPSSRSARHNSE